MKEPRQLALAQTLFHPSGSSFGNYGLWVDITGDWLFVGDVQEELVHIYQPSGGSGYISRRSMARQTLVQLMGIILAAKLTVPAIQLR